MLRKSFYLFFIFILIVSAFSAQNYVVHLDLKLDEQGTLFIDTEGNYEPYVEGFSSEEFSSKKGKYWILNYSSPVQFSYYSFELSLPEGAHINYLNVPKQSSLFGDSSIKILGEGENSSLSLIVQYTLGPKSESFFYSKTFLYLLGGLLIFLLVTIIFLLRKKSQSKDEEELEEKENKTLLIKDFSLFPKRQQDILKLLHEHEKLSQKELEEKMQIPKSSLSRNIHSLEVKGYIEIKSIGVTNYLFLKKEE